MSENNTRDYLSYGDALFLYLERAEQPINVAALGVFEGVIPLDACVALVESKLPVIPRYRQRVVVPPFNVGLPSWENDPKFAIRNHVRELWLKRGSDLELKRKTAEILGGKLDRSRPLWDITLLRGLKHRTGVIVRVHHCLADGMSGVGLLNVLMSPNPETPPLRSQPYEEVRLPAPPAHGVMRSMLEGLTHSCFSAFERVVTAESELLDIAGDVIAAVGKQAETNGLNSAARIPTLDQLSRLLPEFLAPTQRLPFNVVCHGPQKYHSAEILVAEMRVVKRACGATLNDVALALMTSAIRRYAELHGVTVEGRRLRIVVPVSMRGRGDVSELGNQITFLPVTIPLDIRDPIELIAAIRERLAFLKSAHVAELVSLAGTFMGMVPTAAQALVGPVASQLPISACNTICTNVPGPKVPLYLIGHKMLACHPYVATGGEMGMNCAILTYNGTAYFGFTGDVQAMPDVECLGKFLRMSFKELQKAVGVRSARPTRARTKTTIVSAPTVAKPTFEPDAAVSETAAVSLEPPPAPAPAAKEEKLVRMAKAG